MVEKTRDPSTSPSPLEGEGAQRADEGLLAAIAERDQARKTTRPDWRSASTPRLRGFARTMRTAMVIAVVCALGGLLITVYVDLPPGGVIVLATIAVYILSLIARPFLDARRADPALGDRSAARTGRAPAS